MEASTRDWAIKVNEALEIARTILPSDAAPTGFTKLLRGSRLFITFEMHGFYYLVLTKYSYNV